MKLQIAILLLCTVAWSEAHKHGRQGEGEEECCYPRPPPRKERGFKRHASQCCEVPVAELWEEFTNDLNACKEEKHKKPEEPSTTTMAPPPPPVKDNEFDAEPSDSMENEDMEEAAASSSTTPASETSSHQGRHHEFHKGRKGGKHHHGQRGCMKQTMEKHGWSTNGTINWDVMEKATEKATNESVKLWVDVVKKAIHNCTEQAAKAPPADTTQHHCPHHFSAEKQAWRCVINSSIMNCPNFPNDNEYCVKLREVYQKCSAKPYGKHVKWCKSGKKRHQPAQPVA